jgi:Spy/CpxP family protein refolding chaperone
MAEYKENENLINNDEELKTMLEDQLEANKAKIEAEMKAMEEAATNYSVVMMGKADLMENLTLEQEARFMEILETEL